MQILNNIPLNDKNWFKSGGKAQQFCEPVTTADFQQAFEHARQNNLPVTLLGEGANVLIADDGINGLVIRPGNTTATVNTALSQITAGAGMSFSDLIEFALNNNLLGLEEFSGIPGSIGGSVYINIHYYEFLLSQFFVSGTVIEQATGTIETVTPEWFNFAYDDSKLMEKKHTLIDATFQLRPATTALEIAYARGRRAEIIRHRNRRYPTANTCGSFFRNFLPEEFAHAHGNTKIPFVGYYLDQVGVKGTLTIGSAKVSHLHANMIVTFGDAPKSGDVIALTREMQRLVSEKFGIIPQPECQLLGFATNPYSGQEHI